MSLNRIFLVKSEKTERLFCTKQQEKKKSAAEKSKEAKEADEWKSGCTLLFPKIQSRALMWW